MGTAAGVRNDMGVKFSDGDIVDAIYAGAAGPHALKQALGAAVERMGASGGNIHVVRKSDLKSVLFVPYGPNYSDADIARYFEHWRHLNPYREAMRRTDGVFLCHEHFSEHFLSNSAYAQDFFFELGERWLAGAVCGDAAFEVSVVFARSAGARPFGDIERNELEGLFPHFRRAASMATRANEAAVEQGVAKVAIASSNLAAWLVDAQGRMLWANSAGEDLLRESQLLRVSNGRLSPTDVTAAGPWQQAIRQAAARSLAMPVNETLRLFGEDETLALEITPSTIPDGALLGVKSAALVLARRVSLDTHSNDSLNARFGFTKTEANLAMEVARGRENQEIAERRNVSLETVRTQLRSIYSKAGVATRAQLVALMWRLSA